MLLFEFDGAVPRVMSCWLLAVLPVLVSLYGDMLELPANADGISTAQEAIASRKLPARKGSTYKSFDTNATLMKHKRTRLFLFNQALIAPTIILLIYSYINYRQITPFQYPGVNRSYYSLILDFAFHNAFHHGYSYLPRLKPVLKGSWLTGLDLPIRKRPLKDGCLKKLK